MREASQTLLVSVCLIGLYVVASMLFGRTEPKSAPVVEEEFHLGCYHHDGNITHSLDIETSLYKFKFKMNRSSSYKTSWATVQDIESKGIEATLAFEKYLMDLNEFKESMSRSVQMKNSINNMTEQCQACQLNALQEKFPEAYCQETWDSYQNCSVKLKLYKDEIEKLLGEKEKIEEDIKKAMPQPYKPPKVDIKEDNSNHKQREYRKKDGELELKLKKIQESVKLLRGKVAKSQLSYKMAQSILQTSSKNYADCHQSRKQFRLCQELSEEVKNLGHGNIEDLSNKLVKKRASVLKMKALLNDMEGGQKQTIIKQKNIGLEEYKKIYKIYAQLKLKSLKSCGCTEQKERSLFQQMEDENQIKINMKKSLQNLKGKLKQQENLLFLVKSKRHQLFIDYQNSTTQLSVMKVEAITQRVNLDKLKAEQSKINTNLLAYEQKLSKLDLDCEANQKQLSALLSKISEISNCRNKKEYLANLKQSYEKNKQSVQFKSSAKNRFIKLLNQFNV